MLIELADSAWIAEDDKFSVGGLRIGSRMTIIRLNDGSLFVHSPIALSKPLLDSIDSIGKPKYIIAPNTMHHLFARQFQDPYRDADLYIVPGLKKKRKDLSNAKELSDSSDLRWSSEIKQHSVRGISKLEEVVFFDQQSKTLILTDLAFYITANYPLFTRAFFWLNGAYNRFSPSWMFKLFFLKHKSEFKRSIDYILEWDFERIIISHGKVVETGGKKIFRWVFRKM